MRRFWALNSAPPKGRALVVVSAVGERGRISAVRAGGILQQAGATKAIVSMAGNGTGRQNVLVRADLLIQANGLQATSFQLEFLTSGTICNGTVNHIQKLGFDGTCHLPDHSHRAVHAHWQLIHGPDLRGTITATTN